MQGTPGWGTRSQMGAGRKLNQFTLRTGRAILGGGSIQQTQGGVKIEAQKGGGWKVGGENPWPSGKRGRGAFVKGPI